MDVFLVFFTICSCKLVL